MATAGLPVRLAVLVPAVENAISGDAMRPGDVLDSRKGLTIEVGNTDAEGRLILADALTRAERAGARPDPGPGDPDRRGARGPGAAAAALLYRRRGPGRAIAAAMRAVVRPLWRMPLWKGYVDAARHRGRRHRQRSGRLGPGGLGHRRPVPAEVRAESGPWAHFDIFAWNPRGRPGWPSGGEARAIRALYRMIRDRFA